MHVFLQKWHLLTFSPSSSHHIISSPQRCNAQFCAQQLSLSRQNNSGSFIKHVGTSVGTVCCEITFKAECSSFGVCGYVLCMLCKNVSKTPFYQKRCIFLYWARIHNFELFAIFFFFLRSTQVQLCHAGLFFAIR